MSKENQIEEISKILCGMKNGCDGCMFNKVHCNERNYAEKIYNAGYRKQSEWISVEERLPERTGKYLVFTYNRRLYIGDFIDHYCDGNPQFDDYKVTHWMPLPEPPKKDGGE